MKNQSRTIVGTLFMTIFIVMAMSYCPNPSLSLNLSSNSATDVELSIIDYDELALDPMLPDVVPHSPIVISNDDDFETQGFLGSGIESDPYRIENYAIHSGDVEACINITGTTAHFVIQECVFTGTSSTTVDVGLYNVINGVVFNNTFLHSGQGVLINNGSRIEVTLNTFYNQSVGGVFINVSDNCTASYNNCTSCEYGVVVLAGDNNQVNFNLLENCTTGIFLKFEPDHLIVGNVTWNIFGENGVNAIDDSSTSIFDYNYWSDYLGNDSDMDGFGDTWYQIQGTANNNDTHPLVYHPTLPSWDPPPHDLSYELGLEVEWMFGYSGLTIYAPIVGWSVNDTTHFSIDDGTLSNAVFLEVGVYPLEVAAINIYGLELTGTYTLTVSDTVQPTILGPNDFEYIKGQVGQTITWIADDYDPGSYIVTLDEVQVMSGAWNSTSENVTIDASGLSVGNHTYVITFLDGSGNSATDIVVVTVLPSDIIEFLPAAGVGGAIILVIVVIYLSFKKRSA